MNKLVIPEWLESELSVIYERRAMFYKNSSSLMDFVSLRVNNRKRIEFSIDLINDQVNYNFHILAI
jgi:hypothetical protein